MISATLFSVYLKLNLNQYGLLSFVLFSEALFK